MKKHKLPNMREATILGILINGEKYGREIRDEFEARTGQRIPLGSLYTTLERMAEKGFLKSRFGDSVHERGGNRRKHYRLTATGSAVVNTVAVQFTGVGRELTHARR